MRTLAARVLDSTHLELTEPILSQPGQYIEITIPRAGEEPRPGREGHESRAPTAKAGPAPGLSPPRREREMAWCRLHEAELESYAGQWVVLEGEEIIAHGHKPAKVVDRAREKGVQVPYVFYVEEFELDVFKMGL